MILKNTPVAIFIAATALIGAGSIDVNAIQAKEKNKDLGGLKEWTTDQKIDDESKLDKAAKKAAEKAKKSSVCIPVGEGENCW